MLVIVAVKENDDTYRLRIDEEKQTQKHKFKTEEGFFFGLIFIGIEPHQVEIRDNLMYIDSLTKETPTKTFTFVENGEWVHFETT